MKIQYISDLHLELQKNRAFFEKYPVQSHADYLVLAGDIVPLNQIDQINFFLDHISQIFSKVFWVPGNHEFYGSDYKQYQSCNIPIRENVFLINNQSVLLDDYELVFSTLWTNLDLNKRWFLQYHINDFKYIKYRGDHIDALDYNGFHTDALSFLVNKLQQPDRLKKIVVTHHCPVMVCISDQENFSSVYGTPLDKLILKYQPLYWVYGHTNTTSEITDIGNTRLLTNQFDKEREIKGFIKIIDF
ncbi:metallophosphoesterase [Sphingobacterium yanglingense]|uniref:Icc-related predicted phosphoesterase n=1 Tax=Sphingobacterium yanglingense TaxID=1437280 RepID=A0A4R6WEZ9_9SPHI|nr:metallophosphoesterase [Sphingobacterium yanglingense]TDQ78333.1 Icc-related predicted phosphoesterase [Sphingobacterium yanglingense]